VILITHRRDCDASISRCGTGRSRDHMAWKDSRFRAICRTVGISDTRMWPASPATSWKRTDCPDAIGRVLWQTACESIVATCARGIVVEPTLMVIGLNHRTAPLAMRERFWISENRRYEVLRLLKSAEGIEEIVVLSTCCRTEFLMWASEPSLAANSLLHFLGTEHGLKLSEWEHFYRLLDESALIQILT